MKLRPLRTPITAGDAIDPFGSHPFTVDDAIEDFHQHTPGTRRAFNLAVRFAEMDARRQFDSADSIVRQH